MSNLFHSINQKVTIIQMTIKEITEIIDGRVICCEDKLSTQVEYAFSSDLMSDVLTVEKENLLLMRCQT